MLYGGWVYPNAKAFGYIRGTCGCIQMRRHSDTYGEHAGASKCEGIRIHTGNMRVYPNAKAFGYGEYGGDTTSAGSGTASSEAPTFAALVSRSWREAVATKRLLTPAPLGLPPTPVGLRRTGWRTGKLHAMAGALVHFADTVCKI